MTFTVLVKSPPTFHVRVRPEPSLAIRVIPRIIPADGEAATIAVGTVTSLPNGSTPTVTNAGTANAAVFNFGIPEGAQGDDGLIVEVVAGTNVSVDNTDPARPIINVSGGGAVDSVNGQTGVVVLDADDIDDTSTTNKFVTSTNISEWNTAYGWGNHASAGYQPLDSDLTSIAGLSTDSYGRSLLTLASATALQAYAGVREVLTANRTYYVRTDGSDSNNGLANTSGGAFLTLAAAYAACLRLDFTGYTVTISVQSGTYTAGLTISSPWLAGTLVIDLASGAHISPTSGTCLTVNALGGTLQVNGPGKMSAAAGSCIVVNCPGIVNHSGVEFGACSGYHLAAQAPGTTLSCTSNYTISGGAAGHVTCSNLSYLYVVNATVTITGTPNFSSRFATVDAKSYCRLSNNTYSGSATGTRYLSSRLSYLRIDGATLPGDVAGSTSNGGLAV